MFPLQQPIAIFLVVIAIILLTPMLFRRIRVPQLVGFILAGIAIGPHGFDILARDASFEIFGQVGILYLMFLAGVEIDMVGLKRYWKEGVLFGLLSFALPMGVGMFAMHQLPEIGWTSAVLIATMLASHTLITYPTVARFGLSGKRSVIVAVCGTIVAVLLSLITLAEVVAMKEHGHFDAGRLLLLLGGIAIYMLVLGYIIPYTTRYVFRKYHDNVTPFIYVLAVMFVAAILAQAIGLEPIVGAFYAGLIMNRFIPPRSGLMSRISFVGNAIFIPYFLIGVGMLINITVLFDGYEVLYIGGTMIAVALSMKWLASWITQKLYRQTPIDRKLLFGLTGGKAAATIAATMVGYQCGLLSVDAMNAAVLMILVCCMVAPIVTERAAKRIRMNITDEHLHEDDNSPKRVNARQLVAVSNPITARGLMRLALYMRHPANTHPVNMLFVRTDDDAALRAVGRQVMDEALLSTTDIDIKVNEIERYDVNVVTGMVSVAKEKNITDIFVGMHVRSNIVDSYLGTTIEHLLESTNKMVILNRCYVPVNTIARLVVFAPPKAEYETGFTQWVTRIGNLATQLSCRIVFMAYPETIPYIRGVLKQERYDVRQEYIRIDTWDDFLTRAGVIHDNDLMVVVSARRSSISYSHDLEQMPTFLNRYFSRHNLLILFPEQFGAEASVPNIADVLATDISTAPPSVWETLRRRFFK